jgi:hypothetical protein
MRRVVTIVLALGLGGLALGAAWWVADGMGPPDRDRVERNLFGAGNPGRLLAYAAWDGRAYVVFAMDGRVYLDGLKRDWVDPPSMRWQWTGAWYAIPATGDPASLGSGRRPGSWGEDCGGDTVTFGQVNDGRIAALELACGGERRRYPVAAPGFLVRLEGCIKQPTDPRWLDTAGQVVWPPAG